jgi:hypothetical protein
VLVGTAAGGVWQDVVRFGVPIVLSDNNTQYTEIVAGQYRVAPVTLPPTAVVFFQEDETTDHDAKITYILGQENVNQNGITALSSPSIAVSGNGTSAAPLSLNVKYSADADNLAHAGSDGGVAATLTSVSSPSVTLTGDGTSGSPLTAQVKYSADVGNLAHAGSDGGIAVFAPSNATPTPPFSEPFGAFNISGPSGVIAPSTFSKTYSVKGEGVKGAFNVGFTAPLNGVYSLNFPPQIIDANSVIYSAFLTNCIVQYSPATTTLPVVQCLAQVALIPLKVGNVVNCSAVVWYLP